MPESSDPPEVHPYGRWPSPLAAGEVASGRISYSDLQTDGTAAYWLESRPAEGGRVVLVRKANDQATDHSPADVSIRSRVHEYGGGAVRLVPGHADGAFVYVDQTDQRVWFCNGAGDRTPRALSGPPPEDETWNHGGLSASPDGRWVLAVREVHDGSATPRRTVVSLSVMALAPVESTVFSGHDFYGAADLHPTGDRVVATAWDHPNMPWDASIVLAAQVRTETDLADGEPHLVVEGEPWVIAGGEGESVGQPAWRPDGTLRFVSDRTGWWLPYLHSGGPTAEAPRPLTDTEAEFHGPDWVLGQRTMADLPDGSLVARMVTVERDTLVRWLDPVAAANAPGPAQPETHHNWSSCIAGICADGDGLAVLGSSPEEGMGVSMVWRGHFPVPSMRSASDFDSHDYSWPTPIAFHGRTGRFVHATLYEPKLLGTTGPPDTEAPLIVFCHSGPTSAVQKGFDGAVQFFTSRGFAVAQVDYAGSSGYGRAYRTALDGQWGIADAEDCLDAARHLATHHAIDATRMAARGGSAGGFTALNALAAGEGFAACVSWYGVTDLLTLAASTHDFEAHYTDRLVGPLPDAAELYRARSPLTHAADMTGAVLLLQGADDPVVPLSQAQQLHDSLIAAGRTCELRIFEGEGHGFRRADTLEAAYEAELAFYRTHLRL